MINLENVTLVTIDSAQDYTSKNNIRLAAMSRLFPFLLNGINFGDILSINPFNKNKHILDEKFDTLWPFDWDNREGQGISWYSNFLIKRLPFLIKTDWYLIVQWDGFPLFFDSWNNEFFNYPYIGGGHSVHNGGFSLRNTEMMLKMSECTDTFDSGAEDGFYSSFFDNEWMCNRKTPFKIQWPDESISRKFASFKGFDNTTESFGWHRSGFYSPAHIAETYRNTNTFSNNEIDMLVQYSLTKDIPDKFLVPNYIKLFDIEYNENFYQY